MALITFYLLIIFIASVILFFMEDFSFEKILFEEFSAIGTVGLSMGITSCLSNLSKIIVIILMFLGRIGLLTLIFAFSNMKEKKVFVYPKENINIS